jgi:hypothetical protein
MKTKAQEWFLLKKNWMEDLNNLSDEDFGRLVRSLFTSGVPQGNLSIIYGLLKDEYDRVNEKREEGLAKRREASAKAVQMRTTGSPVVTPEVLPQEHRTHTHTHTHTHTKTDIQVDNIKWDIDSKKELRPLSRSQEVIVSQFDNMFGDI